MSSKLQLIGQFMAFLWGRKKFWLLPIVIIFALIGLLLVSVQGSVVAPFIYTLF